MEHRRKIPIEIPDTNPHHCSPEVRLQVLGQVALFSMLDADGLAQVDRLCHTRGFASAEAIYHTDDVANRLYVVATGHLKTTRVTTQGRETLLDVLGPGDFLGALPALGQERYSESAWALTPACLLGLDSDDFNTIMEGFPAVMMAALRAVSGRLSDSQEAVHLLSGAPLEQRLAATLLLLAAKVGVPRDGSTLLQLPLSRDDLAAMTGAATESVSRLMSRWHRDGLVESGRRWVAIRDRSALEHLRGS